MLTGETLQAEVADYVARFADERDEDGRRLVVRNGSHEPRDCRARTLTRWAQRDPP